MTAKFYIGKVCAKHPELKGRRYVIGQKCPSCEKTRAAAWARANPGKRTASTKAWQKANPEKKAALAKAGRDSRGLEYQRIHARKSIYGITEEQYQALIVLQNNCCAICMSSANGKTLHIDHDHATGKVRSLLCNSCNHLLGNAKDTIELLKAAIKYLRKHSK